MANRATKARKQLSAKIAKQKEREKLAGWGVEDGDIDHLLKRIRKNLQVIDTMRGQSFTFVMSEEEIDFSEKYKRVLQKLGAYI
jgi:hypothetical protein